MQRPSLATAVTAAMYLGGGQNCAPGSAWGSSSLAKVKDNISLEAGSKKQESFCLARGDLQLIPPSKQKAKKIKYQISFTSSCFYHFLLSIRQIRLYFCHWGLLYLNPINMSDSYVGVKLIFPKVGKPSVECSKTSDVRDCTLHFF